MSVDKKKALTLFALTMLIVSLLLVNMNEPLGAPVTALSIPPTLYVDPPLATRVVGSTFEINVSVRDVTVDMRLVAVQFRLTYNTSLLEVKSVTEGQFLRDPRWNRYGTWFYGGVEPDGVWGPHVLVGNLLLPNATGGWEVFPYGGGNIATVTFRCKGPGGCPLRLLDTILQNDTGSIPHLTEDGQVYQLPLTMDLELYPRAVLDLGDPTGRQWHELHPNKTNFYNLTSWEPGMVLSPEDMVWMDGLNFEVDDVTIDIVVHDLETGTAYWLDYECGYWTFDPKEPNCTKWNEIKNSLTHEPPFPPRCWHLTSWSDTSGDGELSYGDVVNMTVMYPYSPYTSLFHVGEVTVTLKLTEVGATPPVQYYLEFMGTLQDFKAMDLIHYPWGTLWTEIWPLQGLSYTLTNWIDQLFLSPSDQILLTLKDPVTDLPIPGAEAWYHVDKLTVAMNLTSMVEPFETHIVKFEGSLQQFKIYHWIDPNGTQWHEVNPQYCRQWYLAMWSDNGNGYLDYCDKILMIDKENGTEEVFHVESLSTDIWVTQKIHDVAVTNVTLSATEAYPTWIPPLYINVTVKNKGNFTETFTVTAYYDNNPIDTRTVTNLPPGNEMLLQFTWRPYLPGYPSNPPAAWPYPVYVISANASIIISGEINVTNNHLSDGSVKVKWPGDMSGDGHVELDDLDILALSWWFPIYYNVVADMNMDGQVELDDLDILALWWFRGPLD